MTIFLRTVDFDMHQNNQTTTVATRGIPQYLLKHTVQVSTITGSTTLLYWRLNSLRIPVHNAGNHQQVVAQKQQRIGHQSRANLIIYKTLKYSSQASLAVLSGQLPLLQTLKLNFNQK